MAALPRDTRLVDVTPLQRSEVVSGVPTTLVSFEEWTDRSVVRLASPAQQPVPRTAQAWGIRRDGVIVARSTAGGGGYRGGLNVYEVHFAPAVPHVRGLELVRLDRSGEVEDGVPLT